MSTDAQKATTSFHPKLIPGKEKFLCHSIRHKLTGQLFVLTPVDLAAYKQFEIDIMASLKPDGGYEKQLAISIVQDHWRLNRARGIEFNIFGWGHDNFKEGTQAPSAEAHAAATMTRTWLHDDRYFEAPPGTPGRPQKARSQSSRRRRTPAPS